MYGRERRRRWKAPRGTGRGSIPSTRSGPGAQALARGWSGSTGTTRMTRSDSKKRLLPNSRVRRSKTADRREPEHRRPASAPASLVPRHNAMSESCAFRPCWVLRSMPSLTAGRRRGMSDSNQLTDQEVDLKAWRLKVHTVDMALREVQNGSGKKPYSKPRPKAPFMRALPSRR